MDYFPTSISSIIQTYLPSKHFDRNEEYTTSFNQKVGISVQYWDDGKIKEVKFYHSDKINGRVRFYQGWHFTRVDYYQMGRIVNRIVYEYERIGVVQFGPRGIYYDDEIWRHYDLDSNGKVID